MPARQDSGRVLDSTTERTIAPPRTQTRTGSGKTYSSEPYTAPVPQTNIPIYYPNGNNPTHSPFIGGGGSTVVSTASNESVTPNQNNYGTDPLGILSDIFLKSFGANSPYPEPKTGTVVSIPQASSGSGNTLLILGVLAAAGFGIYYFYFRKKKGGEN